MLCRRVANLPLFSLDRQRGWFIWIVYSANASFLPSNQLSFAGSERVGGCDWLVRRSDQVSPHLLYEVSLTRTQRAAAMAATRNAPLQLHDTSKTISWPNSAAVSQVIPRPPAAPSGAVHMRVPAAPPALPVAAKANPAPRIGFTPNMLQNVRGNLKRAQPRSRQQSEEPPETRQRQASPAPHTIVQRQARSRGHSAEPQEPQPLRNLLKNPIKLPANRPAASPANTAGNCGCKKLDFASEKALSGILMHMTSVLTVISNQNAKLDKQSERLARMEEMQQKQSEDIQKSSQIHADLAKTTEKLQIVVNENEQNSSSFRRDLKLQLEQIGIDIVAIRSSDSSRGHSSSPDPASFTEDMLKLIDERLQSLLAKASSSPPVSPQQSASCAPSARYDADVANVLSKVERLTELHANLSRLPEVRPCAGGEILMGCADSGTCDSFRMFIRRSKRPQLHSSRSYQHALPQWKLLISSRRHTLPTSARKQILRAPSNNCKRR